MPVARKPEALKYAWTLEFDEGAQRAEGERSAGPRKDWGSSA